MKVPEDFEKLYLAKPDVEPMAMEDQEFKFKLPVDGKKVVWVTFNANGSICSVTEKQPTLKFDQWDRPWLKMVSE